MKLTGTASLQATPEVVYSAFNDPAVLARCLPGCESLTEITPGSYAMTITTGVAAIKGTYQGRVALVDGNPPSAFTLKASGSGGPGTLSADIAVHLSPAQGGGTDLTYDADAVVGGAIGGVGQRMLGGVAKKMAGQFFAAVDTDIAGGAAVPQEGAGAAAGPLEPAGGPGPLEPAGAPGRVFAGARAGGSSSPTATANLNLDSGAAFLVGAVVGGLLALAGAAVGARLTRAGRRA